MHQLREFEQQLTSACTAGLRLGKPLCKEDALLDPAVDTKSDSYSSPNTEKLAVASIDVEEKLPSVDFVIPPSFEPLPSTSPLGSRFPVAAVKDSSRQRLSVGSLVMVSHDDVVLPGA